MDDPRAAEGVEHLQGAARELLKAARSFLDVVEDVVEDPDRLTGAAAGLVDVVRTGLGRQDAPWVSAAWDAPADDPDEWLSPEPDASETDPSGADPSEADASEPQASEPEASVPDEPEAARPVAPGSRRRAPDTSGPSRVRRIAVD